ncbi:GTPase, G3E family [Haladaptatus litoreus]|uniref:GTPase, G3E family n=2 Tax=Haladaptatus litoreus TaxID=553468 RepID=A0A1N6XTX7_9EURY|nr:GTPase, G3E family [Haladaptatus litoreus]
MPIAIPKQTDTETMGDERIPITVVTGCLGAGKTTLINHVLDDPGDRSVAVVVNDVGEVNVDTELIQGATDDIVDLSNGCLCCQLQDDLRLTLALLRDSREFDCLLIEASGVSEPIPLARTLLGMDDEEVDPTDEYRLDTMVSVVDSVGFANAFDTETGQLRDAGAGSQRPLTDVLVETVEFCDLLLLNKCDVLPEDSLDEVEALVRELQPNAELIRTIDAAVPPETILETDRFDFEEARRSPGWKHALASARSTDHDVEHDHGEHSHREHDAETESVADRIETLVYERERPFHPDRLNAWLDDWDGSIARTKGVCWIAGWDDDAMGLNQAGPSVRCGSLGEWNPDERTTRLVLIGTDIDEDSVTAALDRCLVRPDEGDVSRKPERGPFPRR